MQIGPLFCGGGIYGLVLIAERVLKKSYGEVNVVVQWMYTFSVVSILWLLFRSDSVTQWALMIKKMFSFESLDISQELITIFALPESSFLYDILHMNWLNNAVRGYSCLLFIVAGFTICLIPSDNYEGTKKNTFVNILMASVALVWAVLCLGTVTTFVYSGF